MIVFKIPFGSGGLGKSVGCKRAPDKIIEFAKKYSATENSSHFNIEEKGVAVDDSNISGSLKKIEEQISSLPFVALGGDHTITYSILKKIAKPDLGVVIFDAHPDMMQRFSVPTHENYLRHLIEEGILRADQVTLIGLRSIDPEEKRFLNINKINYITMHQVMQEGLLEICDIIMENMNRFEQVYVSVDIDVVDPAFAPGTGNPEIGGLSSKELLYILKRLMLMKNYSGGDIVEVNPELDVNEMTLKLAGRILVEMCGK